MDRILLRTVSAPDRVWAMTEGVGPIFRRLRLEQDKTLEAVADAAGVHRNHLGRIERGEGYPTVPPAVRIARQLGHRLSLVPMDVVCEGEIEIAGTNGDGDDNDEAA